MSLHRIHLIKLYLDVLERLVQEDVSARVTVLDDNLPGEEPLPPHPGTLELHAAPEGQLDQDAAPEPRADAVIPEAGVALLVLEPHQQDLLHQGQPRLLAVTILKWQKLDQTKV